MFLACDVRTVNEIDKKRIIAKYRNIVDNPQTNQQIQTLSFIKQSLWIVKKPFLFTKMLIRYACAALITNQNKTCFENKHFKGTWLIGKY